MEGFKTLESTKEYICERCNGLLSDYSDRMWSSNDSDEIETIKAEATEFIASKGQELGNPGKLVCLLEEKSNERLQFIDQQKIREEAAASISDQPIDEPDPYDCSKTFGQYIRDGFIAVTSNTIEGYRITQYHGIATGTAAMGKGVFTAISDAGGENTKLSGRIEEVKNNAMRYAIDNAAAMGGNALIATNVSINAISSLGGVISSTSVSIVVMVSGTSVTIEKID